VPLDAIASDRRCAAGINSVRQRHACCRRRCCARCCACCVEHGACDCCCCRRWLSCHDCCCERCWCRHHCCGRRTSRQEPHSVPVRHAGGLGAACCCWLSCSAWKGRAKHTAWLCAGSPRVAAAAGSRGHTADAAAAGVAVATADAAERP
jgi:hypothetical protein